MIKWTDMLLNYTEIEELPAYIKDAPRLKGISILDYIHDELMKPVIVKPKKTDAK
jgi:hypothetical protein